MPRIAIIGLGYVGLPLGVALAQATDRRPATTATRPDRGAARRPRPHRRGDAAQDLAQSRLALTDDPERLAGHEIFIITVPTPVDRQERPDLSAVVAACRTHRPRPPAGRDRGAGEHRLSRRDRGGGGSGAGRELRACAAGRRLRPRLLARADQSRRPPAHAGADHQGGRRPDSRGRGAPRSRSTAGSTGGQVHLARDIRTAEAAKAIENAQRDINIAFVNEVAMICQRLGLSVHDVLAAARTKWNFLDFPARPGRRPLHRRRSLLSRPQGGGGRPSSADHPGRAHGQRRHAGVRGGLPGRASRARRPDPGARPDLQGERAGPAQLQGGRAGAGADRSRLCCGRARPARRPCRGGGAVRSAAARGLAGAARVRGLARSPCRTAPTPGSTLPPSPACSVRVGCSPTSRVSGVSSSCRPTAAAGRSDRRRCWRMPPPRLRRGRGRKRVLPMAAGPLPDHEAQPAVVIEPASEAAFGEQIVEMRQALAERKLQLVRVQLAIEQARHHFDHRRRSLAGRKGRRQTLVDGGRSADRSGRAGHGTAGRARAAPGSPRATRESARARRGNRPADWRPARPARPRPRARSWAGSGRRRSARSAQELYRQSISGACP